MERHDPAGAGAGRVFGPPFEQLAEYFFEPIPCRGQPVTQHVGDGFKKSADWTFFGLWWFHGVTRESPDIFAFFQHLLNFLIELGRRYGGGRGGACGDWRSVGGGL